MQIGRLTPPIWFPDPRSAQGPSNFSATEPAGQHLVTIEKHDRYPIAEFGGNTCIVDVDDLEVPTPPADPVRHQRQSLGADGAGATGDEANRPHHREGSVQLGMASVSGNVQRHMRPMTALTIVLLMLLLTVAGILFVIQLLSVT